MHHDKQHPISLAGLLMLAAAFAWGAWQLGPIMLRGHIQPAAALLAFMAMLCTLRAIRESLNGLARFLEWLESYKPTGKEGTASWARFKDLKDELTGKDEGPFWGMAADKPGTGLFIDFVSNAYIVGPSGSGKGHTSVVNMILSIPHPHSKIIVDYKPELLAMLKKPLEAMGQVVIALDAFGVYAQRTGASHQLNPLDVIADDLYRPGGLRDVFDDCGELNLQLSPESKAQSSNEKYFGSGTRKVIAMATQIEVMFNEHDATLANVSRLIEDRQRFLDTVRTIAGVNLQGEPSEEGPIPFEIAEWAKHHDEEELAEFLGTIRARAKSLFKKATGPEARNFESFMEGAEQALEPYAFGRLSPVLGRTSFDVDAIKSGEKSMNIFLVGDASRTKATENFFGLVQWYLQLKLKRHPNKHVPVYQIMDEAANYSVYGLLPLLSWGRGFGIRTLQIFQNFTAYKDKHGEHAVEVLNSESEIKLFLPGQRAMSTLKDITASIGNQSVMVARLSAEMDRLSENTSESARPLATEDELRRSEHGILMVRQHKPMLQIPVSYSEIEPYRSIVDTNPHFGKPFLQKVKLRLKGWNVKR